MKVLCLGNVVYDITIPFEGFPIENSKNRVSNKIECGGGQASTAAYLLGSWGIDVYIAGVIGNDLYGKKIIEEFNNKNVNTKYLEINDNYETTSCFIINNIINGSRTTISYNKNIQMSNFNLDFIPDIILIDGQEYEMSKYLLDQYPDSISIIDAGRYTDNIVKLSKKVNWLICSKEFATKVTNIEDDINLIYNKMKEIFNNNIIITLEEKGCFYNNELISSIKVKQKDSTGAGDIFHGAFTYYLSKGYDIKKILKLSNIAGAISVTRVGTRNSIPSIKEVQDIYES